MKVVKAVIMQQLETNHSSLLQNTTVPPYTGSSVSDIIFKIQQFKQIMAACCKLLLNQPFFQEVQTQSKAAYCRIRLYICTQCTEPSCLRHLCSESLLTVQTTITYCKTLPYYHYCMEYHLTGNSQVYFFAGALGIHLSRCG